MDTSISPPMWLPDWQEEEQYPRPGQEASETRERGATEDEAETLEQHRWAWEFLRRNPEYQRDHARLMAQPKYRLFHAPEVVIRVHRSGRASMVQPTWWPKDPPTPERVLEQKDLQELMGRIARRYGLGDYIPRIFDPAYSTAYRHHSFAFVIHSQKFSTGQRPLEPPQNRSDQWVGVGFDLQRPLEPQLERTRDLLKGLQKYEGVKVLRKKPRVSNFPLYLRILDARACGATLSEIASVIYPTMSNEHPDFPAADLVKKNHKAARKLRDRDYLFIAS